MQGGSGIDEMGPELKGITKNPIGYVGFVGTPHSMEDFQNYLSRFTGSEAAVAQTCAWLAWNLAAKTVERAIEAHNSV